MLLNLINDAWIPVRRRNGESAIIRPAQIVEKLGTDHEIIAPDWPRPDLNVATLEFLIGLLSVTMPPDSPEEWSKTWHEPPDEHALSTSFAPWKAAFNLNGNGPRFMQDFNELDDDVGPIESLLIDSSGENAAKKNADLMVRRKRYECLSLPAAAISLYALQQFAPSGGAGHRTSMRGGGPMTTLAIPPSHSDTSPSLWQIIWANVRPAQERPDAAADMARIFPWMAPSMTSEKGAELHEAGLHQGDPRVHVLQCFFGMPRRIRLVFEQVDEESICDLTGARGTIMATGIITRPYGINYGHWKHPLSPYSRKKEDEEWLPMHPVAGRKGYRNWLGVVIGDEGHALQEPASAVIGFREHVHGDFSLGRMGGARILMAGWAMSNMSPLDFLLAEQPFHIATDREQQKQLDSLARRMVKAAEQAMTLLRGAAGSALKAGKDKPKPDSSRISALSESFFARTEDMFHDILDQASDLAVMAADKDGRSRSGSGSETGEEAAGEVGEKWRVPAREWLAELQHTVIALFDENFRPDPADPEKARKIVEARRELLNNLRAARGARSLYTILGLPPEKARARIARRKRKAS